MFAGSTGKAFRIAITVGLLLFTFGDYAAPAQVAAHGLVRQTGQTDGDGDGGGVPAFADAVTAGGVKLVALAIAITQFIKKRLKIDPEIIAAVVGALLGAGFYLANDVPTTVEGWLAFVAYVLVAAFVPSGSFDVIEGWVQKFALVAAGVPVAGQALEVLDDAGLVGGAGVGGDA